MAARRVGRRRWRVRFWTSVLLAHVVGSGPALALAPGDSARTIAAGSAPQGSVDAVTSPDPGRVRVRGWAFDRDAPTAAVEIHVYVGGPAGAIGVEGHVLGLADRYRPDVHAAHPGVGDHHGYDTEVATARTGTQSVYVYALDVGGTGGGNTLLGTRAVLIQDPDPIGTVDLIESPEAAQVRVRGWGFDRNALGRPIGVRVYVGAPAGTPGAERHDLGVADELRPDVASAHPGVGDRHGFDRAFTTNRTGGQTIFVYGVNIAGSPGADTLLGSRAITITAPDKRFVPMGPTRILDSRPDGPRIGPFATPWGPGTTREVTVAGAGTVPTDAAAVVLNTTVTGPSTGSHLTMWPAGEAQPTASNLNWDVGWTVANAVTVKVGAGGRVSIYNSQGTVDVVLDVVGYYRAGDGAGFTPLTPTRVIDSRRDGRVGPFATPWGPGVTRDVRLAGVAGVPAHATAVVLNATATNTTGVSFLTVWPAGRPRPHASSLNWRTGWSIPNAVTVELGAGGSISVFNNANAADVVLDVVGYFTAVGGKAFHPVSPARVQDSRPGGPVAGAYATPWTGGVARDVVVTKGKVPTYATAVVLNVTATNTTAGSHLTVWPTGSARPVASSVNWQSGWTIPNAVTAPVGVGGKVGVYNHAGAVDVVADLGGWYG